jgi:hypothetical protein
MTPVQLKCPICEVDASAVTVTPRGPSQDVDDVQCRRCGIFAVAPGHIRADFNVRYVPNFLRAKGVPEHDLARASSLLRRYLSIYTRECSEQGLEAELLNLFDLNSLERLAETYSNTSIAAKPEKLLRLLSRRTQYPGAPASFNAELDYPAVHAVDAAEFAYYARALTHQGLIETPDLPQLSTNRRYGQNFEATITLAGWTKLGATGSASRTAFVAMSFDASLDPAFLDGISRGISDAGLEPLRVD